MEYSDELIKLIQPGNKVELFAGDDNPYNDIYHIRAIVDEQIVVYRTWSKAEQRWRYGIDSLYTFKMYCTNGWLSSA